MKPVVDKEINTPAQKSQELIQDDQLSNVYPLGDL